jgi:hypothetical protein
MRPRIDGPLDRATAAPHVPAADAEAPRDAQAIAELYLGFFRRDLRAFFPRAEFEALDAPDTAPLTRLLGPGFRLLDEPWREAAEVHLFGRRYRLALRDGHRLGALDRRMIRAIADVLTLRYDHLFAGPQQTRLDLYRGGSDDHYVAAFVEPSAYAARGSHPSRIAATIQTLRTAALSTYENRRVSTGALLLGAGPAPGRPAPADALAYGVELTALKSIHRLCDGRRTLFLVDRDGRLAEIIDVARWAEAIDPGPAEPIPCARAYAPHARATASGGHVCLVLSPNQEIKLFAEGRQAFAFTHGRWRILDPAAKFARWRAALDCPALARTLFQAALDMAEDRQGGLFVVVRDPEAAVGPLLAPHDRLDAEPGDVAPSTEQALRERDPLARRALHYLARGCSATALEPSVLEALASLDGALVTDSAGRLLAFGAILRQREADELPGLTRAEGARTTAALAASLHGPVLKVSEDGIVSCFLDGARAWDL